MSMIGYFKSLRPAALDRLLSTPAALDAFLYEDDDEERTNTLDIDKSWHLIHFLLNGDAWEGPWPLGGVILGGTPVSDEDLGYGPARYFTSHEVEDVARALEPISPEELWSRFDADAVRRADIYPQGWSGAEHEREYISQNYSDLRRYLAAAASRGDALVAWLG
jgi:hypothetical protein